MFVDAPDFYGPAFGVSKIDWTFDCPASNNVSLYSSKRSIATEPWKSVASAHVELEPIVGDANIRAIRSFLRRCKGQAGVFRLFADIGVQNLNADVTVSVAASAGDTTLHLAGYETPLLDGQFATVNGQLLQLVADQDGDQITFEGKLRQAAGVGTPVQTARPYALVYLASSATGWSLTGPAVYGVTFDVQEAIGEPDSFALDVFDTTGERFDETDLSMDER